MLHRIYLRRQAPLSEHGCFALWRTWSIGLSIGLIGSCIGSIGVIGSIGLSGSIGLIGSSGSSGLIGSIGLIGLIGSIGLSGLIGSIGLIGASGSSGFIGMSFWKAYYGPKQAESVASILRLWFASLPFD